MRRLIFGVGSEGRNGVLYDGALWSVGMQDERLAASADAAGERVDIAWAARGVRLETDDYGAEVRDFNLQLKPGETRFVRVVIAPGAQSPPHRTPHIVDYLVALAGELTMCLEDGSSVKIAPGDMFVQLAGWHSWKNEGHEPFIMAGVIIGIETTKAVPSGVELA